MRKSNILIFTFIFLNIILSEIPLFSQELVRIEENQGNTILSGIWQGKDRLVLFEDNNENEFNFSVVLRVFYAWYNDRAAEIPEFSEIKTRDRNDAEGRPPENISIRCRTVFQNPSQNAGVYELELIYPAATYTTGKTARTESVFVPVAVIDGKIYLDFYVNPSYEDYGEEIEYDGVVYFLEKTRIVRNEDNSGFWVCASNADGITISPPRFKKEVSSYYVVRNEVENADGTVEILEDVYKIRYWKSGMDYSYASATFTDGNRSFEVPKFLKIGDDLYQCTTGRSTKIRNIEKMSSMPEGVVYDSDNLICAFGKPYLVKVPHGNNCSDLLKIVQENNKRRKDPPKPIFPVKEIDFHWKEISELEKYNPFTWNRRNVDLGK